MHEEKPSAEEKILAVVADQLLVTTVVGHYARDCQNPTTTCNYCKSYDHTIEECPTLIAKIREPKPAVH